MASFQFDSGRSRAFGDVFAERQAPIGPSGNNSALLDRREWTSLEISLPELESVSQRLSLATGFVATRFSGLFYRVVLENP